MYLYICRESTTSMEYLQGNTVKALSIDKSLCKRDVYTSICVYIYIKINMYRWSYGAATISRLLKVIRLFCRIPSLL